MSADFRLLMIGAMYENGGNVTHRCLDGHPSLYVYPYESQLGTRYVDDLLASTFPKKYRWPVFALDATPEQDYRAIIDEEAKIRARTPHVSKFRHRPFEFSDDERRERYVEHVMGTGRSRANNVAAFFRATFEAWRDYRRSGSETVYVGYSPILVVDAAVILAELPRAVFLHVVRNPWSAYADTKKRAVPLALDDYMLGWTLNQQFALRLREEFSDRLHIVRSEDTFADPVAALAPVLAAAGVKPHESLRTPSWNGEPLDEVYPWGTVRRATPEANAATAAELSTDERRRILAHARPYVDAFGYGSFAGPAAADAAA